MLVLVTAATVFVAYHANWIRQRRAFLEHAFVSWDPDPTLLDPFPRCPGYCGSLARKAERLCM